MKIVTKLPISLVIITANEEKNIERCLRSVPFVSEVIVLDSYSQDSTVLIAHNLGARVFQEKWKGYGRQKASAVEKAKYEWILSLDADEALSPELAQEIVTRWPQFNSMAGYLIPRKSFFLGRWIGHGGWFPDYQLRFFHRGSAQWSSQAIHEKVQVEQQEKLKNNILHWVFDDISDQVKTNDKYSSLQAEELARQGKGFRFWKLLLKPPTKFIENYFWKLGFLDGLAGFIIAVSSAYSVFLKWAKIWELEKNQSTSPRPGFNPSLGIFTLILAGMLFQSPSVQAVSEPSKKVVSEEETRSALQKKSFPQIQNLNGNVEITNSLGPAPAAREKTLLRGALNLQTKALAHLRIQLDPDRLLELEPESEVNLPGISPESGEVPQIVLKKGQIRLRSLVGGFFPIEVSSALFSHTWTVGDHVFGFDPKLAKATVWVNEGSVEFSALNSDEKLTLKAGQKASFQGVIDEGELVYDVLLQGRKVARGQMGAITEMTDQEKKSWDPQSDFMFAQKQAEIEKARKAAIAAKPKPGEICQSPRGRLNDCAWICRQNSPKEKKKCHLEAKETFCERVRCLADGRWGDPLKLPKEEAGLRCTAVPKVARCDY